MDGCADITLTPPYARSPAAASAAVAVGANPSAGSFGFASAGASPTTGPTRGLFMAPRTTSAAAGGARPEATCPLLEDPKCIDGEEGQGLWEEEQGGK
ncbi:hypothetical protein D1007_02278 [Hordeum vulgare]|nr:hypothetical protein D1007_02278 [Hordeum vulgare]